MQGEKLAEQLTADLRQLGVTVPFSQAERLLFLAERKFNRFDLYAPGETFQIRLLEWLMNFEVAERQYAMEIVWSITFLSHFEMRALATATFHRIKETIQSEITGIDNIPLTSTSDSLAARVEAELAQSLFIAVSDDVLLDFFRRYAQRECPSLMKDNFVEYYKLDRGKRGSIPPHTRVFLLDQLTASGTTFLRNRNGAWEGKLATFSDLWPLEAKECKLYYRPYVISSVAEKSIGQRLGEAPPSVAGRHINVKGTWKVLVSSCLRRATEEAVDENKPVARLCKKYYPRFPENEHTQIAGPYHYGYGGAGLTLVLNTNCPNNTIPLIWQTKEWAPLFPRIEHHR